MIMTAITSGSLASEVYTL